MQVAHIYVDMESNDNSPLVAMAGLRKASVSLHAGTADLIDRGVAEPTHKHHSPIALNSKRRRSKRTLWKFLKSQVGL